MLNLPFPLRRLQRCCPPLSGVLLIITLALAVRGGARDFHSSQNGGRSAYTAHAVPGAAQTERTLTNVPTGYTAIAPKDISIQSPSDATVANNGKAVYRITINPDDATQKYYVCIDYNYLSINEQYIQHYDGKDEQGHDKTSPLPYAVTFEAGVTHMDVTLATVNAPPKDYEIFAYAYGMFNTNSSAPLIVEPVNVQTGIGQSIPTVQTSMVTASSDVHTESAIGQSIPISCTVPDDPIQAGVEGFDCTAAVKGLYGAASGNPAAAGASKRKHSVPPTIVEVDCSDRSMYRPGKGFISLGADNGWPARLKFPAHRRQAAFTVEHSSGTINGRRGAIQLIFYSIRDDGHGKPVRSKSFSKNIEIVTVNP